MIYILHFEDLHREFWINPLRIQVEIYPNDMKTINHTLSEKGLCNLINKFLIALTPAIITFKLPLVDASISCFIIEVHLLGGRLKSSWHAVVICSNALIRSLGSTLLNYRIN